MHSFLRILPHALLALVVAVAAHQATAGEDLEAADESDVSEITLGASDGRVAWSNIIRALAETERFDAVALDNLPDGELNLNSRGARLAILALDLALPPECSVDILPGSEGAEPQLRITLDRAGMRERTRDYKRRIRERVGDAADFGLRLDDDWPAAPGRPLVVLIHGYNSRPDSLAALRQRLRDDGWVCGLMSYPDDGPIDESAALVADELRKFGESDPDREIAIVAHSMGGLVARAVIEDPDLDPGNVRQLIMVGTPNHGSMLAQIPGGFDCIDHLGERGAEGGHFFARAAADGFNEAAPDMRPDSAFLRRLNARDRNPRVKYSLLLGTRGPLTEEELDEFRSTVDAAIERNRLLQFVSPRIEAPLADLDELRAGKGDGAVAVKRGRLKGVEDTQLLPFSHFTITKRADEPDADELFDAIVARLNSEPGAD